MSRKYYNNNSMLSDLRKFLLLPFLFIFIFCIANFFSYTKTMECGYTSCSIYRVENSTKKTTLIDIFNESQIEYITTENYSTVSHTRSSTRSVRIYPVVYLKNGRKIVLDMVNLHHYDNGNIYNNLNFEYFRNKKF